MYIEDFYIGVATLGIFAFLLFAWYWRSQPTAPSSHLRI